MTAPALIVAHDGRVEHPTPNAAAPASLTPGAFEDRLAAAASVLWERAAGFDVDGASPEALCTPLHRQGLFIDALPVAMGGSGLATAAGPLACTLMTVGGADLSAGRIFEGHVNAVKLVLRYGDAVQHQRLAQDIHAGAVCGVWNAEAFPGLRLDRSSDGAGRLVGGKIYSSGIGLVTRPLVTAKTSDGDPVMLALRMDAPPPHDLSAWTMRGMRATATGTVDLTGLEVSAAEVVGAPGDYYRGPLFKGGAWRFAAVQTGGLLRIAALMRGELRARRREGDPHQKARIGAVALAAETAELWVMRAAALAEDAASEPTAIDAYVNLTRLAVERAALEAIQLAERGLGLAAFARPNPIERVVRDLSTYLRQPFPDGALEDAAAYLAGRDAPPPWSVSAVFPR